jgi:hypothetical protein
MQMRTFTYVSSVTLLIFSLMIAIVLAEGCLRLFPDLLPEEIKQQLQDDPNERGISHPYIGYLQTPNHALLISRRDFQTVHHTDGHGFRNAWPWPEKAEIIVLGDSLAFGYGVEDDAAWPAVLSQALPQLRVVNLGLIGAGPFQYVRVYETFGLHLHPQVLLVGLFVGNDFRDAELFNRWLEVKGEDNYMVWRDFGRGTADGFTMQSPLTSLRHIFRRNSYFYNLLRYAHDVYSNWQLSEPRILQFADGSQLQLRPSYLEDHTLGATPDRPEFQLVLQALQHIQAIAEANGSYVLFIFQPSKEEVYMPLLGEAAPDPGKPLQIELDRFGLDYLDLTPPFRQRARAGERLFFETDGHPNQQGYRLIAEEVLAHLKQKAAAYGLHDIVAVP